MGLPRKILNPETLQIKHLYDGLTKDAFLQRVTLIPNGPSLFSGRWLASSRNLRRLTRLWFIKLNCGASPTTIRKGPHN